MTVRFVGFARRRIWAINAFSDSGTAVPIYRVAPAKTFGAHRHPCGLFWQPAAGSVRPPVICPTVTPGYPTFGNPKWSFASLTGGTQFVTVDQSFTQTFGRAVSSAINYHCRQDLRLRSGRRRAGTSSIPKVERPKKSGGPNRRSATSELGLEFRT